MVKRIDLTDSKEFWNTDEKSGYKTYKASDGVFYKVWIGVKNEKFQKNWWYTVTNQQ